MLNVPMVARFGVHIAKYPVDTELGKFNANAGVVFFRHFVASDPAGVTTVTFVGVNAGSEIRIYFPDGSEAAGIETCVADQVLTWPVYAGGSPNNTVRVVVIHTAYKIKEFNYGVTLGNQSLPIQQEPDKWFSNPI